MELEKRLINEKEKEHRIKRELKQETTQNEKLKAILDADEVPYKTFYSTLIVLTVAYFVGCAIADLSILEFLALFFPYQFLNAMVSVGNAYLKENSIKKKLQKSDDKVKELQKQKELILSKIEELENNLALDKNIDEEGNFSKQDKLEALRNFSDTLKQIKIEKEYENASSLDNNQKHI